MIVVSVVGRPLGVDEMEMAGELKLVSVVSEKVTLLSKSKSNCGSVITLSEIVVCRLREHQSQRATRPLNAALLDAFLDIDCWVRARVSSVTRRAATDTPGLSG